MTQKVSGSKATPRTKKPTASEVAPGVFVGGWRDAVGFTGERLCVLDELPTDEPFPGEGHLKIYDEAKDAPIRGNLDRLATMVEEARTRNQPVLLFCGHGIRRSPLAAAWYLHRHEGLTLDEAFARIRAVRPKVQHVKEWASGWKVLA